MQIFLRILLAILTPASDANVARHFAPNEMIVQAQDAHAWAARITTAVYANAAIALLLRSLDQPDVQLRDVAVAWVAAELEATPHVDAPLLLAIMWPESRYQPTAGPACGVMQVYPHDLGLDDASACALWKHDVLAGVRAGVLEIETLLADHRVHSLREALLYRACGNKAFTHECAMDGWVNAVFARRTYLVNGGRPKV